MILFREDSFARIAGKNAARAKKTEERERFAAPAN